MDVTIRPLEAQDIEKLAPLFDDISWGRRIPLFERYLREQDREERIVLTAHSGENFAGYVTIVWKSDYPPFAEKGIPEIKDLNVLSALWHQGVASELMDEAERRVFERSRIAGIGFGISADYGAAQSMYVLRGYVPDGRGLFGNGQYIWERSTVQVDDCVIYLTKDRGD